LQNGKEFERFSIYKISIDYPSVSWVELNPRSRRERGDIVFHFPEREKIFLSWGNLEDARRKFPTIEDHAEHGIEDVRKNAHVKNVERVAHDSLEVNSHEAVYNYIRLNQPIGLLPGKRIICRDALLVHLRCPELSRFFVIFALLRAAAPEHFSELFLSMTKTLECH
jgi:hypothetical protein